MTTSTIYVTPDDIEIGVRRNALHCPVANAMKRHWPSPAVGNEYCWPTDAAVKLPMSAQRFTERFDAGKPVKPFKFTLKV